MKRMICRQDVYSDTDCNDAFGWSWRISAGVFVIVSGRYGKDDTNFYQAGCASVVGKDDTSFYQAGCASVAGLAKWNSKATICNTCFIGTLVDRPVVGLQNARQNIPLPSQFRTRTAWRTILVFLATPYSLPAIVPAT